MSRSIPDNNGGYVDVYFKRVSYPSGHIGVIAICGDTGEPEAVITKYVPGMEKDETAADINTNGWPLYEYLEKEGLLKKTNVKIPQGYCVYPIYKVTKKLLDECI